MVNITLSHCQITLSLLPCFHASAWSKALLYLSAVSQSCYHGCSLLVCFYSCIKFDVTFITCPFVTSLCSAACVKGRHKCMTHSYLPQISGESWNGVLNMCQPVRHLCSIPYLDVHFHFFLHFLFHLARQDLSQYLPNSWLIWLDLSHIISANDCMWILTACFSGSLNFYSLSV